MKNIRTESLFNDYACTLDSAYEYSSHPSDSLQEEHQIQSLPSGYHSMPVSLHHKELCGWLIFILSAV